MEHPRNTKNGHLSKLQVLISKMSLQNCCVHVPCEFDLRWNHVSRAVRNARLPMTPTSVATVLCKYAAKTLTDDEVAYITTKLSLKSIAVKPRNWHVINLSEQIVDGPINMMMRSIPSRVKQALNCGIKKPQVQTVKLGELVFISAQLVGEAQRRQEGSVLYVASPPGQPLALVSSLRSNLLSACVRGLGFKRFEDACLVGKNIDSLLRIAHGGTNAAMVTDLPEYTRGPCLTRGGIDFTNTASLMNYVAQRIGPEAPILDYMKVTSEMDFFDRDILNKKMKVTLQVKGENTLAILTHWVVIGAMSPDSKLFDIFANKSNQIHMAIEDVDE